MHSFMITTHEVALLTGLRIAIIIDLYNGGKTANLREK